MRALTWHGKRDVRVDTVPDPKIKDPTDIIVRITSTGICGSDLHLYEVLGPYLDEGDILGHERWESSRRSAPRSQRSRWATVSLSRSMSPAAPAGCAGRGSIRSAKPRRSRTVGWGAALFGFSKLYGQVPGGQAELLRVPFGNTLPVKVPHGPPDQRFVYLSDVLPTAWQSVAYAGIPPGGLPSPFSVSAPSATWRPVSPSTRARARSSASTSYPNASPGPAAGACTLSI